MKSNIKGKIIGIIFAALTVLSFGVVAQDGQMPTTMTPEQMQMGIDTTAAAIGITEEQKPAFEKVMKAFYADFMPVMSQLMSGAGDQAELQKKMEAMGMKLEADLKPILTEAQMTTLQNMQQQGPR
jgi:hypothetical protein